MSTCLTLLHGRMPDRQQLKRSSPIALAFVGDSVFDLYLRTRLVSRCEWLPRDLHLRASHYANAAAQAAMAKNIEKELDEEEHEIFRRGRNAKSLTVPKNARLIDYHLATGFEAVLGYVYLLGNDERLLQLMDAAVQSIREDQLIQ